MPEISAETALFFADHAEALPLYLAFLRGLSDVCPDPVCKVGKTQISLSHGGVFACVSFLRLRPRAQTPPGSFVLTLSVPSPLSSPRAAAQVRIRPDRYTHHFLLAAEEDLDPELYALVAVSLSLAEKRAPRARL